MTGTLAAAYAEAGRFPEAVATAEKAVREETAAGEEGARAFDNGAGGGVLAAVGKGIRGDVEDAHDERARAGSREWAAVGAGPGGEHGGRISDF